MCSSCWQGPALHWIYSLVEPGCMRAQRRGVHAADDDEDWADSPAQRRQGATSGIAGDSRLPDASRVIAAVPKFCLGSAADTARLAARRNAASPRGRGMADASASSPGSVCAGDAALVPHAFSLFSSG